MCPPRVKKYWGLNPHDVGIFLEILENFRDVTGEKFRYITSYNEILKMYDKENARSIKLYGVPEDKEEWYENHIEGAHFKHDASGNLTLFWSLPFEGHFPILRKIPQNILDLPSLIYLGVECEIKRELIPKSLFASDKYQVDIIYYKDKPKIYESQEYECIGDFVDLDDFFKLKIYPKDLSNEVESGWRFIFEHAFEIE